MNTIKAQSFGGQIIEAQLLGRGIFYRPATLQPPPTPARAGVPILFPQFADRGVLIKHGMARIQPWQVVSTHAGHVSTSLLLTEQADWPHRAQLNLDASIEGDVLTIDFAVRNVGQSIFAWTGGLHPYFLVDDVTQVRIEGLASGTLDMRQHNLAQQPYDMPHPATESVQLHSKSLDLQLTQTGFDHWVVWNAGGQHSLHDIPHEDWQRFICIEPICLTPRTLRAGETWLGSLKIRLKTP